MPHGYFLQPLTQGGDRGRYYTNPARGFAKIYLVWDVSLITVISSYLEFKGSLSEDVFLSVDLFPTFPIPCTDESLSSSFICISVASADRTTSNAFSSVRSGTLSCLSLEFCVAYAKYNSVLDERVLQCSKFTVSQSAHALKTWRNCLDSELCQMK